MAVALAVILFFAGQVAWPGAGDREARELTAGDDGQRLRAVLALAAAEPGRARALLVSALADRDPTVRGVAARLLARRGAPEAVEAATAWVAQTAPRERLLGLQVLRDADALTPAARRAVERALRDGDLATRVQALEVLGSHEPTTSLGPMLAALEDEHREVRARAARLLGTTRNARAALPLVSLLADGDRQVQAQAAAALGALGDRHVAGALARLVTEGAPELRAAAVEALGRLGDAAAVPVLVPLSRRGPLDDGARRALGEIGTPGAVDALLGLARAAPLPPDLRGALALAAPRALPRLAAELVDGTATSATLAADVLGRLGDRRATASLVAALERRGPGAPAALDALARLADPASVPALVRAAGDGEIAERRALALGALATIGDDRALVALPRALADTHAGVRAAAVRLAGAVGGPDAIGPIAARLADPEPEVRREAARALASLSAGPAPAPAARAPAVRAIVGALARTPPPFAADAPSLDALGDALERLVDDGTAPAIEQAYLAATGRTRAVLARALAVLGATRPLSGPPVVDALLGDLTAVDARAPVAADALDGAVLSKSQASTLAVSFARADDDVRARLAPALSRSSEGQATLAAVLRSREAAPSVRAAAAWALASVPEARGALGEAAADADEPVAANARAALAAGAGGKDRRSWVAIKLSTPDGTPWAGRWVVVAAPGAPPVWALTDVEGRARVGRLAEGNATLRLAPE